MALWQNNDEVTATFEVSYRELPDSDLTRKTLEISPVGVFGETAFTVTELVENPDNALYPEFAQATMKMSKQLYTLMIRVQQGAETTGDEPPPWALIEGSAVENATGRVLETGEVFPLV